MLVKHAEKLSTEPTELFGPDFKSVLKSKNTDSKQALEFFNPPRQKHPFREGSSPAKQKNQGKKRSFFVRRDRGFFNHNPKNRGGYSGKLSSYSQHVGNHRSPPGNPSFTGKPLCEGKSKQLFGRKNKTDSAKLAKAHKRQKRLKNCEGLGDPFNPKTNPAKSPTPIQFSNIEEQLVDFEVANMLRKGAIRIAIPKENQLLSNIFIRPKKDGEFRPIINLKRLNQFVTY